MTISCFDNLQATSITDGLLYSKLDNAESIFGSEHSNLYYIRQDFNFVVLDSLSLPFEGKINVLQDKFIYSLASNLSSLAKNSKQLISIGEIPDLLGGLQASTLMITLPYSKFIFRVRLRSN